MVTSDVTSLAFHEIQTPLTSVKMAVDLLSGAQLGELNENQRRFVDQAARNVGVLSGLIRDVSELFSLKSGRSFVEFQSLNLEQTLRRAVTDSAVVLRVRGPLPPMRGDSEALARAFRILIQAALTCADRDETTQLSVSICDESAANAVKVELSGPGVPALSALVSPPETPVHAPFVPPALKLRTLLATELLLAHHAAIGPLSSRLVWTLPVLDDDGICRRSVERDVDAARRVCSPLSVVVLRPRGTSSLKGAATVLESIAHAAGDAAYPAHVGIYSRPTVRELVITMPGAARRGALSLAARVSERVAHPDTGAPIEIVSGTAVFPDDASAAAKLIDVAGMVCPAIDGST